jgi:oxygen-independent coproporphyrinogen-3 oxidase
MSAELKLQKGYLRDRVLSTIYFGGGTPSLLRQPELEIIFEGIHSIYSAVDRAEISLEANPDDLTKEKLAELRQLGINRLSIGVQSFDDAILKFLNRAHDSDEATRCIAAARSEGLNNISVDLIYAIPGQPQERWKKNIEKVLHLSPEHVSAYALTIEKKTAFGQQQKKGQLHPVSEEIAAEQFELLMDMMQAAGYEQYEISNFCRPGFHSRHNTSYWQQVPYLGIGPSAHSYDGESRQFNISNNSLYRKAIENNTVPCEREVLTRENRINPDELSGGTFTLTNTGSRGALFDTPIINQPNVAILGTGAVVKRPVVVSDGDGGETISIRSMVYLALSYDHRIVDGADAARFLSTMKQRLEEGAFEADLGL